ncbi:hypothetical protein VTK56DRAFT_2597 [Thermocarpiscus australiensis]
MEPEEATVRFIFVIGAPGAGKGTLCKRLAQEHGLTHLSVGDLLRQIVADPDTDEVVRRHVQAGELLPTEYLLSVLESPFHDYSPEKIILLDGFPRRMDQAEAFEDRFGKPQLVLFFKCPKELGRERLLNRIVGRPGDTTEMFDKRHEEYLNFNTAVLEYYDEKLVELSGT